MRERGPTTTISWRRRRVPRALLWGALVALLLVAQGLLLFLTINYEASRAQERADEAAQAVAAELRRTLLRASQGVQALLWAGEGSAAPFEDEARALLRQARVLARVERRGTDMAVRNAVDSPFRPPLFARLSRPALQIETELACAAARRALSPAWSRSYFVPQPGGLGQEVVDLCLPVQAAGQPVGYLVASFPLAPLLDDALPADLTRLYEVSFVEGDGTRLARAGAARGTRTYVADRVVDLPGSALQLRVDAAEGSPRLIPNLAVALVLGLSVALSGVVALLAYDVRRRARAENALAEALAFRKAMEDSLVTGLRARDREGRITYVNPAFCAMVGYSAAELRAAGDPPPYWPPEHAEDYRRRQASRMAAPSGERWLRDGYESVFMRRGGERFPVMVYDAPLVDAQGRHAGWMSAVVELSEQRRVEDLSRQQQERLQATARLATMGEMASLLSHELNQPLAAIASYSTGSLNLLDDPDDETPAMLRQGLTRIAEQAERAGRVIKSVHDFVRRREQSREMLRVDVLVDGVLPLVRLQARKSGTRIELDLQPPDARVLADRTMLEQVLLNLTRNGIQAMEGGATPPEQRVLTLRTRPAPGRWLTLSVIDHGPGIAPEVAERLFTPFFTTRSEGMGLGLSLCRTVIEQHGGALDFERHADGRTEFRFTLPTSAAAPPSQPAPALPARP